MAGPVRENRETESAGVTVGKSGRGGETSLASPRVLEAKAGGQNLCLIKNLADRLGQS